MSIEYSTDLFDGDRMERMLGHYGRLLKSIIKNPEGRIEELEILTEREREQLLVEWNRTEREYPSGKCVHELFEEQVRRTPGAVAVVFEREELTYGELNARANQVARYLHKLGVGPEVLVGICVERSLEMVVGLLGIMKAGGAYVPFDADYPKNRLEYMLKDSGVAVLLTQKRLVGLLPVDGVKVICLDEDWPLIQKEILETPVCVAKVQNAAYMIYTSGSTGNPKGVVNIHSAIVNRLVWMQEEYQLGGADSVLQKTPFSFDVSVWEFFWPLITGARLVVASPGLHRDPESLAALIEKKSVTVVHFVPSMLSHFLEQDDIARLCRSLRQVICSGEALSLELQQRFFNKLPTRLDNLYGPTEAAVDVSCWRCNPESRLRSVPIGRPIANAELYILDRHLCPTPIGIAGELHIGGTPLARGYHNLPELTAERFISSPYGKKGVEKLYKTGDLCRFLADGNIEYLGRMDHQVKLRGFRIELGEIEAVLRECAGVKEAVVVVREDEDMEKRLVAYVVGEGMTVEGMREELGRKLPEYMMPAAYQVLERLPLTANGKVDRKGLPKPEYGTSGIEYIGPRNPTEVALAGIWCEILRLERVGIGTSFFEVGGTSLLAIQLADRIRRILKREIPVRLVFQNPTIEKMAALINQESMPRRKAELISWNQGEGALSLIFLVDDGSLGLFKVANLLDKRIPIDVSVSPLTDSDILAAIKKESKKIPKLPEMASVHVRNIRNRSHSGPVILVGHCFGGNLAFEVAQQLLAFGVRVETVVMLDTWMTNPSRWWLIQAWFKAHFSRIISHGPAYLLEKSRRRIRLERQALASHLRLLEEVKSNKKREFDAHIPMHLIMRIYRAAWVPKQKPLPLKGILLISRDDWMSTAYLKTDKTLGTQKWFDKGVEVLTVPGDHANVLEEHNLAGVADGLTQAIGRYFQSGSL